MKVVFISNSLNYHQIPFSDEMYRITNGDYYFIQTAEMTEERKKLGYGLDESQYPYLIRYESDPQKCREMIRKYDVVIIGSAPMDLIEGRKKENKLIFQYSERVYRTGKWKFLSPRGIYHMTKAHGHSRHGNMYMLCASAYTALDVSLLGLYKNKLFKWGYFPPCIKYDLDLLFQKKQQNKRCELIWVARFLEWKHPEKVLWLACKLRELGIDFHINMIGIGDLKNKCKKYVKSHDLSGYVNVTGPVPPAEVRKYMENADIYLMTSDWQEGWGVVVNEAMNSGCAVVASHAAGSVPYLIENGRNGIIFKNNDREEYFNAVLKLIKSPELRRQLGENAYHTICDVWNGENAAQAFYELAQSILNGGKKKVRKEGPCSRAKVLWDGRIL